ncbi:MAG: hypothetical protein FWF60_07520 [Oscillospiraceae bacterium]|nr:hypothetical protein [Oscillospiraceae bacterium]
MNEELDGILEEMMRALRGLALEREMSVPDIVREALGEYLLARAPGVNLFDVIHGIESAMRREGRFVTDADPAGLAIRIKSPIRYVYRPELKYEVRAVRNGRAGDGKAAFGTLGVALRTHDIEMLRRFAGFTGLWIELEREYLAPAGQITYVTDAGYFGRQIFRPETARRGDGPSVGEAISNYICVFDELLKDYFNHRDSRELEQRYLARLAEGKLTI